jgi:cytochrome c
MKNFFTFVSLLFCLLSLSFLTACKNESAKTAPPPPADNELSEQEKTEGWKLLFDGKTLNGWHKYGGAPVGKKWTVSDGAIHLDARRQEGQWQAIGGGDIVTNEEYENFELRLEWKIDSCGNSGIIYHVIEDTTKNNHTWKTGPEMQVLDNACHADASIGKHRAGDLYDLIECDTVVVKPHGQWNMVRIISRDGKVEHWLNGVKVVEIQMFENGKPTQHWLDLIAGSKFPKEPAPDFGLSPKGKIALQDHGDKVWYKNIKIKTF